MPLIIIKKYNNRRLYDTATKRYINLEDLAELLRRGDDVQVIHARSGQDLTQETLHALLLELRPPTRHLPVASLVALLRLPPTQWQDLTTQRLPQLIDALTAPSPPAAPLPAASPAPSPAPPVDDLAALRLEIEAIKRAMLAGR
jgi:polyhydroxyalkanoate synthesis repressor PhaR